MQRWLCDRIQKVIRYDIRISENGIQYLVNDKRECGLGEMIVPFGTYAWIDSFDRGLARVRTNGKTTNTNHIIAICNLIEDTKITDKAEVLDERHEHPERFCKWGIINMDCEEVSPVEYDEIWNFKGKSFSTIMTERNGVKEKIYFSDLPGSTFCDATNDDK